jgi:hypothetical protein
MSEQKDYISGLQISGKKHEINAKYLSGKELNDLMTKEPKSCSISELDTTTEPFVRVYFNESGVGQEHIVHTMVFDAYRRQIAYDCTTNSIKVRQYQDFWNSWIEIPTSLKTINGQSLLGSGDIVTSNTENIYIWDISNIFGKNIDVQINSEISIGLNDKDISNYVFPVYKNYLDRKPIYVFNGDNESPIILPAIVSIIEDIFNIYVYTTSKDTNYNQIYGTYSFSIEDLLDDGNMIVTASNYVHRFIEDGDISLKTINGQSLLGSGNITINGGSDDNIYILDVRKENIEKSEVEHIYNHVSNGGIVFIKNDNNGYIIPSNISYDNLDVYFLEFRCHDIFTEYDLSDELRKYIINISTIDGNTYTIDKYISINKYFTECLLDFSNSQTLSKNEFNEIVEALNKGKTPKYKIFDDKNIKIILFNVEEISEDRIFLSSSITSSNTIHTISINKSDNNYIFSYVEADM